MIATYINNGKYYFLDATGKNYPLGFVTSFIQGKEGMVGKGENNFEIVKVPEIPHTCADSHRVCPIEPGMAAEPRTGGVMATFA